MDATQLKRNAVAVASAAWVMATAGEPDIPAIAGEMAGRALSRLGRDTATAVAMARAGDADARVRAFGLARESAAREQRAMTSLERIAPGSAAIRQALAQLPTPDAAEARVAALAGVTRAASSPPQGASRVPALVDSTQGYLDKRSKLQRPRTLHPLMAYEVLNFVDGRRSYADIHRAVAAEADAAGAWYYGVVSYDDVAAYLDSGEKAGVLTVTGK